MTITTPAPSPTDLDGERRALLATLATHRGFLKETVSGLSDADAARRTTVSELCLGGLIKHVADTEAGWVRFILEGPGVVVFDETSYERHANSFRMLEGETLTGLLDAYDEVARRTEEVVASLPSLDVDHPLPEAPWFEPGARWSARRALLHILAETAQHAGHADILREAIDGKKTMG